MSQTFNSEQRDYLGRQRLLSFENRVKIQINNSSSNLQKMGQCEQSSKQNSIQILNIPLSDIQSEHPIEAGTYSYPQRTYTLHFSPLNMHNLQNTLRNQFPLSFTVDGSEKVDLLLRTYEYLSEQLLQQIQGLQIFQVILDQLNIDRIMYLVKQKKHNYSLLIRSFKSSQNKQYLNIAYEAYTYLQIAQLNCKFLHRIVNHFCIQSNQHQNMPISHILQLQQISTNLSLIISHKRKHSIAWKFNQFYNLVKGLTQALVALHQAGLTHNDIRPSNIYYSESKGHFILGSFSNVTSSPRDKLSKNIRESNHYKDIYSARRISRRSFAEFDLYKSDVYSLGMTLLSAFFLCQPIDRKKCAPIVRQLSTEYPLLNIIRNMVAKIEKRSNIFQIQQMLILFESKVKIQQDKFISIEYNEKDRVNTQSFERSVANGYRNLGLIGNWRQRLNNRYLQQKLVISSQENARYFEQQAAISSIQGKMEKSHYQFIKSAQIYQKLGTSNYIERHYQAAIHYFYCGLKIFPNIKQKEEHVGYLRLVVNLCEAKIISGHDRLDLSQVKLLQSYIEKLKDHQVQIYWELAKKLVNIYNYSQNYALAKSLLIIASEMSSSLKCSSFSIKKLFLQNQLMLAKQQVGSKSKQVMLLQIQTQIHDIMINHDYYLIEHPIQNIELQLLHGSTHKHFPNKLQSRLILQKALKLTEEWIGYFTEERSNINLNQIMLIKSQILKQLADLHVEQQDYTKGLTYYGLALENCKQFFGNIYNRQVAMILQNIAVTKSRLGNYEESEDCYQLVKKIIKTVFGIFHKDNIRLNQNNRLKKCLSIETPTSSSQKIALSNQSQICSSQL